MKSTDLDVSADSEFYTFSSVGTVGKTFSDYFVHVAGIASGAAGYTGTLSLVSPVPEPEVYGMMLVGLGFMGFVARHRKA